MIIQLLGANGAGKSTVVTEVMGLTPRVPLYLLGRRVPDAYTLPDLVVAGHYEGQACGGGDTLPRDRVVETLKRLEQLGPRPVLVEGPTGREPTLAGDVRVVYLMRNADDCLESWIVRTQNILLFLRERADKMREQYKAGVKKAEIARLHGVSGTCVNDWLNKDMDKMRQMASISGMRDRIRSTIARCEHMMAAYMAEGVPLAVVEKRAECVEVIKHLIAGNIS